MVERLIGGRRVQANQLPHEWAGLFAPRGTPRDIIDKLNAAAVEALADPAVRSRLVEFGAEIFPHEQQTPEALAALQKADAENGDLATRLAHHSGPRRLAIPFLAEDLHLLFFRQRDWRTPVRVTKELFCSCSIARAAGLLIDMRRTSAGRLGRAKSDYMTLTRGTVADSLLLAGNQASSPVIGLAASLSGKISPASDRSSTRRWSFSKPLSTARRSVVGLRSRL